MNYNEFLNELYDIKRFGNTPNLLVVKEMLKELGNPEKNLKFIHIAGTNGKGSLSNYLSCALCDAGYKVGLFTSPFIEVFNERFKINGENISDELLGELGEKVFKIAKKLPYEVKQFDIITVIGIYYFYIEKCDYVVFEAGMGGRYDSTNVVTPVASAVMTIDYDHTAILGDTLEKIAYEKAGIIKKGIPLFYYPVKDDNIKSILINECKEKDAPYKTIAEPQILKVNKDGTFFSYENEEYMVGMMGKHQVYNASVAIEILKYLKIPCKSIYMGIKKMRLTGRFEKINDAPTVYIDGGHNPQGAKSIVDTVKYHNITNPVFVISMIKEKDMATYIDIIKNKGEIILTSFDGEKCHNPEDFKEFKTMDFSDIIKKIKQDKTDTTYVFCGSLYQVSIVKKEFRQNSIK